MHYRTYLVTCLTCFAANPALAQPTTTPQDVRRAEAALVVAEASTRAAAEEIERTDVLFINPTKKNFTYRSRKLEKGTVLGLTGSPVPAVLRDQLQLKPGIGLVVDFVTPSGPAAGAGLRKNDVVERLDDQLLVNAQQLAVLVRLRKPGETVKLSIIRAGKPQTLEATLADGDVAPLDELSGTFGATPIPMPMLQGQFRGTKSVPGAGVSAPAPSGPQTFGLSWSDGQHTFNVAHDRGRRHLTAIDKSGKEIFAGPIDTDEQMERVPKEIRAKVKSLKETRLPAPATGPIFELPVPAPVTESPPVPVVPPVPPVPHFEAAPAAAGEL